MTPQRALEINAMLVDAWFTWSKIRPGPFPVLEGISLAEALDATERVIVMKLTRHSSEEQRYTAHVSMARIPDLHAYVVATNALERIGREHAAQKRGLPR